MPGAKASVSYFTPRFISSAFFLISLRAFRCASDKNRLSQDCLVSWSCSTDAASEVLMDISDGGRWINTALAEELGPGSCLGMSSRMTMAVDDPRREAGSMGVDGGSDGCSCVAGAGELTTPASSSFPVSCLLTPGAWGLPSLDTGAAGGLLKVVPPVGITSLGAAWSAPALSSSSAVLNIEAMLG